MKRKLLLPILVLVLALSACNLPSRATETPTHPVPVATTPPAPTNTAPVPLPPTAVVPTPTMPTATLGANLPTATPQPGGGMTLDMLKNANYHAPFFNRNIKLANGVFQDGSPATLTVQMAGTVAFGDMTGDGKPEAAVILAESGGGSGVFESLVIMEFKNGAPYQTGEAQLGDRVQVKSVDISQGVAHLDLVVPGPTDPACCPSLPEKQNYWLFGSKLTLMRLTTTLSDTERVITITSPDHWSTVNNPFTVSGSVSVLPFENNLSYKILRTDGTVVNEGSTTVTPTTGTAGTFSQSLNLSSAGITDWVIIQFADTSAADGSFIALNSVILKAK
jgi:hypothetical protein